MHWTSLFDLHSNLHKFEFKSRDGIFYMHIGHQCGPNQLLMPSVRHNSSWSVNTQDFVLTALKQNERTE